MSTLTLPGLLALLHDPADFSWTRWSIHWDTVVGCLLFAGLYLWGIGPARRRHQLGPPASGWRVFSFMSGIVLLFLSLNGPLHDLSDYFLFSAHMFQHLLLTLVVAPLWLLGAPGWLLRPLIRPGWIRRFATFATSPIWAFIIFNAVFIFWHLPRFYNWALYDHNVHIVQHLTFIAGAVIMWWPAVNPLPELRRVPSLVQMLYLFTFVVPMSIVAAIITFSDQVLYSFYAEAPRLWDLSPLDDQRLGGLIMWIPAMNVYWIAVTVIFFRWYRVEEQGVDDLAPVPVIADPPVLRQGRQGSHAEPRSRTKEVAGR